MAQGMLPISIPSLSEPYPWLMLWNVIRAKLGGLHSDDRSCPVQGRVRTLALSESSREDVISSVKDFLNPKAYYQVT